MVKNVANHLHRPFFFNQCKNEAVVGKPGSFKETLEKVLGDFERIQEKAREVSRDLVLDGKMDSHGVMIAEEEARLAFQLMLEVRNKLVEAYQELMRIQF